MLSRFAMGSRASLLVSCLVLAFAASPSVAAAADPAREAEGKKAFAAGVNLVQDPDGAKFEEALPLFRKAYDLLGNWKVLGNLGICAMKLERDGEAIDAFEAFLRDGGKGIDKDERAQTQRDLDTLRAQSSKVHLEVPAGSKYVLDERIAANGTKRSNRYEVRGTTLDLRLRQGFHRLVVHTDKDQDLAWETELAAGASASHRFEISAAPQASASAARPAVNDAPPPAPAAPSKGTPTSVYVAGGVTGALVVGAVVTGVLAHGKHEDFDSVNGAVGHTKDEADALRSSGKSLALVSTVLTGAAVVGAGVTAYLLFSPRSPKQEGAAAWVTVGPGSLAIGGRY